MKILIYGSTYLTELVVNKLITEYDLVGYIPSANPFIRGNINLPTKLPGYHPEHDIKLSIQYDKLINLDGKIGYNIHTGLLPMWGGCDILYHTKINQSVEQGLTFHQMTSEIDAGHIVSKITYSLKSSDTIWHMYEYICQIIPSFALSSLKLVECGCISDRTNTPRMYKKGDISDQYLKEYKNMGRLLKTYYGKDKGNVGDLMKFHFDVVKGRL